MPEVWLCPMVGSTQKQKGETVMRLRSKEQSTDLLLICQTEYLGLLAGLGFVAQEEDEEEDEWEDEEEEEEDDEEDEEEEEEDEE